MAAVDRGSRVDVSAIVAADPTTDTLLSNYLVTRGCSSR